MNEKQENIKEIFFNNIKYFNWNSNFKGGLSHLKFSKRKCRLFKPVLHPANGLKKLSPVRPLRAKHRINYKPLAN